MTYFFLASRAFVWIKLAQIVLKLTDILAKFGYLKLLNFNYYFIFIFQL